MEFNKNTSKIAITIPRFKLLKHIGRPFEGSYNEPYIVSIAMDAKNAAEVEPKVKMNSLPFPKVAEGNEVMMLGDGYLVYGPDNPGEYVGVSILIMESNSDIRDLGQQLEEFLKGSLINLGIAAILAANPGIGGVLSIVKAITEYLSVELSNTGDEKIFKMDGVYLRDSETPYNINKSDIGKNNFIELEVKSIPLEITSLSEMEFDVSPF